MPLIGADLLHRYVRNFRALHLAGRYGGGKTSLAFRLAYDFMATGEYRYLLSNVKSIWNDDPAKVELRDGRYVDAVVILDEAGEFMGTGREVREWLSYLRKLNIILLLPSYEPPAPSARFLQCENVWDGYSIGVPLFRYKMSLKTTNVKEAGSFWWAFPSEVYGIYDTDGYPADDAPELLGHLKRYTTEASASLGYSAGGIASGAYSEFDALEEFERQIDQFREIQEQTQEAISVLARSKKRGRK